ncbi:MAG: hypothetical protein J6Q11_01165 [Fibrobacteraceae bacterium]|nr:hypothetical protein [Fibrobacteraceae bacterium]
MNYRSLCSFYKGEKECPFDSENGNAGKFWMAERFVCEEYARNVDKQVKSDFFRMVVAYISKWAPYDYLDLIREYLSKSKADEKMKALIASMFSENIL